MGRSETPPFSTAARLEAGLLLRQLQQGQRLSLPHSRPLPALGARCHELRIQDAQVTWRAFAGPIPMLWSLGRSSARRPSRRRSRFWMFADGDSDSMMTLEERTRP